MNALFEIEGKKKKHAQLWITNQNTGMSIGGKILSYYMKENLYRNIDDLIVLRSYNSIGFGQLNYSNEFPRRFTFITL